EPADVLAVEAEDGPLVLGAGGEPRLLVLPDRPAYPLRLGGEQFLAVSHPPRHAGRASAKDHALQRRGAGPHPPHGPPAPRCPPAEGRNGGGRPGRRPARTWAGPPRRPPPAHSDASWGRPDRPQPSGS